MTTPPLILGSMRFGTWGARLAPAEVARLLAYAIELGIDTLDLADIYGGHTTNVLVGAALARHPGLRDRIKLVAKAGIVMPDSPGNRRGVQYYDTSPAHLARALDTTLRDLGTDRLEVFMLHRPDPLIDPEAVTDGVHTEQARGRIGSFGLSNVDAHDLALFDGRLPVVANQIELSLTRSNALDDGTATAARARGAALQARSPLGGGALLNRLDDALAHAVQAVSESLPRDACYALWQAARGRAVP